MMGEVAESQQIPRSTLQRWQNIAGVKGSVGKDGKRRYSAAEIKAILAVGKSFERKPKAAKK
jgi:DNA-binding transcriptional MerR regulator